VAEHLKRYRNHSLTPKRHDEHPCPFHIRVPVGEMCGCRKSTPTPSWVIGNTKGGEVQKPKLLKESKTKIEFLQGL